MLEDGGLAHSTLLSWHGYRRIARVHAACPNGLLRDGGVADLGTWLGPHHAVLQAEVAGLDASLTAAELDFVLSCGGDGGFSVPPADGGTADGGQEAGLDAGVDGMPALHGTSCHAEAAMGAFPLRPALLRFAEPSPSKKVQPAPGAAL